MNCARAPARTLRFLPISIRMGEEQNLCIESEMDYATYSAC